MSEQTTPEEICAILWKASYTAHEAGSLHILAMLFLKYISDVWRDRSSSLRELYDGDEERIHIQLQRERFVLPAGTDYHSLYEQREANNIGELINSALQAIEVANQARLEEVFGFVDFNSEVHLGRTKPRNAYLKQLLEAFQDPRLDFRPSRTSDPGIISKVYECLIAKFVTAAPKTMVTSYTPAEVSELLVKLLDPQPSDRICDPVCGTGSLLIRCAHHIGSEHNHPYSLYGQEVSLTSWALAKLNMYLHGIENADIRPGDTLRDPKFIEKGRLQTFDVVAADPPYSLRHWRETDVTSDPFNRFWRGVPSTGDYAFVSHVLETLDLTRGRAAIVLPPGVLSRGHVDGQIRRQLIEENLLDAVIGLPPNLAFHTSIPLVILIFRHDKHDNSIMFIDASQGYEKKRGRNSLPAELIEKIVSAYVERSAIDQFSYVATSSEVASRGYVLSIAEYVDTNPHFLQLSVPANYQVMTLGEISEIRRGRPPQSFKDTHLEGSTYLPFIRARNITPDGEISASDVDTFLFEEADEVRPGFAQPGDILITTKGAIGRAAIVPDVFSEGVFFDTVLCAIRVDRAKIEPLVVLKSLLTEATQVELARLSAGSMLPNISVAQLEKVRLFIPPPSISKEQLFAQSLADTLKTTVIEPLESLEVEFDNIREQIVDALQDAMFTVGRAHLPLRDRVLQKYPLPLAVAYSRMLRAAYNPYEQVFRLIELYESLTLFLYYLLLAEYIESEPFQKHFAPTDKEIRGAYKRDGMDPKIKFIRQALEVLKTNRGIRLKVAELVDIDPCDRLDFIRNYRNSQYHSTSGSENAQRILAQKLKNQLDSLLNELSFLEKYHLCRADGFFFRGQELYGRFELFKGATLETAFREEMLYKDPSGQYSLIDADREHVILLTPNLEYLNLHPFYQIVSTEEFRHESHLCFAKYARDNEIKGESIQFRTEISLDGYALLDNVMMQIGLKKG